jgi:hypothetical protein
LKNGYQSLVGSVVIYSELGRKDQCSTHTIAIGRRFKSLDVRTDPEQMAYKNFYNSLHNKSRIRKVNIIGSKVVKKKLLVAKEKLPKNN